MADAQIAIIDGDQTQIAVIDGDPAQVVMAPGEVPAIVTAVPGPQGPAGAVAAAIDGSAALPSIAFASDTDTGLYRVGANQLGVSTGGTQRLVIDANGQIEATSLGTAAAPTWTFVGDPNTGIYSPGADQVAISTNGTGRLFVDASGNVGVGLTTPSSYGRLAISGSSNVVGYFENTTTSGTTNNSQIKLASYDGSAVTAGTFLIETASSWTNSFFAGGAANTSVFQGIKAGGVSIVAASASAPIKFYAGGESSASERLRITSDGKLGLGTSSVAEKLHIQGAGRQAIRITNSTLGSIASPETTAIDFYGYLNNSRASIEAEDRLTNQVGGWLNIKTANASGVLTTAIHVNRAQQVGIGTTSPGFPLQVQGVIYTSGRGSSFGVLFDDWRIYNSTTPGALVFDNGTERARIDSSGRLLVGTSSARSNVQGSLAPRLQVEGTDGSTSTFTIFRNQTNSAPIIGLGASGGTAPGDNTLISAAGLGTINFYGTDGVKPVRAASIEVATDGATGLDDMPGRLVFSTTADGAASPTERLRITSAGLVGIGTTSPAGNLHILSASGANTLYLSGGSTNTNNGGTAQLTAAGPSAGWHNLNIRTWETLFTTNGTERARIDSSGRLLVGTSSDAGGALLQVNGNRVRIATAKTPSSASDTGTAGEICWDASYIYVCTATNTWKRTAIATW